VNPVPDASPGASSDPTKAKPRDTVTLTVHGDPKMLREALCVAEHAVNRNVEPQNQHGALQILAALIRECDRHRPLGPDGKHGDRHTDTCGCDDVPHPLDPSKVKAGDTVTVTGGGGAHPAYEVTGAAWEPDHSPGTLWVGPVCISSSLVTLTAHQPAPEPEPEWKRGQVAVVTPSMPRGEITRAIRSGDGNWHTDGGGFWEDDEVANVRLLVVIDPADLHVVEVAKAMHQVDYPGLDFALNLDQSVYVAKARAALAYLGIEAPR
jgi:hypothetical protein